MQCMHIGSYDSEPETIAEMHAFMQKNSLVPDFSAVRQHHEIYLNDARRTAQVGAFCRLRFPELRLPVYMRERVHGFFAPILTSRLTQ